MQKNIKGIMTTIALTAASLSANNFSIWYSTNISKQSAANLFSEKERDFIWYKNFKNYIFCIQGKSKQNNQKFIALMHVDAPQKTNEQLEAGFWKTHVTIRHIYVNPAYQKEGYCKKLLAKMIDHFCDTCTHVNFSMEVNPFFTSWLLKNGFELRGISFCEGIDVFLDNNTARKLFWSKKKE